ncbi:putative oxidoreductase [Salinihabitans flavidus]|uniref:Putative oxidoreductase n=1 Tax=Salinihabitans flavidus TaxID=569882 RepID=A0A1H8R8R9_9RHOB|nr:DoxX family membrane protein [Salinihabitans flavidus]SEO62746.1 putative oxidoreductase [Salinihabitans flavidus]
MIPLISLYDSLTLKLERAGSLMPLLARFLFAAVLLLYFWQSAMTKLGDGIFGILHPSTGAYAQIFPRAFEAVGYDSSQLSVFHWAVTVAGTWAEFILPLLIVLGLLTRLAALGMIGFVVVQSATDIVGHGADPATIGAWFDGTADAAIMDQRAFWIFALLVLVIRGAGAFSLDRLLLRNGPWARPVYPPQARESRPVRQTRSGTS